MSKKVLITGGAGFVGSHLIDYFLQNTDWEIVSLDRLDFSGNLNRLDYIVNRYPEQERKRVKVVFHDLKAEINPLVANAIGNPDIILHVAAASQVDRSIEYPLQFIHDNVLGAAHVLEYARKLNNIEALLYFSTDEVLGNAPEGIDYKENDRYNSTNPYSSSKAAAEQLWVAWENTYRIPGMMITRSMNIYGEMQNIENFIPRIINKVDKGDKVIVHASPDLSKAGSRFYIYVKDVCEAIMFLLTNKPKAISDFGGIRMPKFHIVGKEETDNLKLAQMIADIQGKPLVYEMVDWHSSRPGHDSRYSLSGNLMRSLGWEPTVSLHDRLVYVNDWFLKHPHWLGR